MGGEGEELVGRSWGVRGAFVGRSWARPWRRCDAECGAGVGCALLAVGGRRL